LFSAVWNFITFELFYFISPTPFFSFDDENELKIELENQDKKCVGFSAC
jgi:hypothetical protein